MNVDMFKKDYREVQIGVDHYTEHWDESLWETDIMLMKETGVKVVRVVEFAWSRLKGTHLSLY